MMTLGTLEEGRATIACWLRRHDWHRHPGFSWMPVRECRRCLRAESRGFGGRWYRRPHVERSASREASP